MSIRAHSLLYIGMTYDTTTLAQRQIIVYLEKLDPAGTLKLTYAMKAKYPINARIPISKAYPYYNPEKVGTSKPAMIAVRR